MPFCKALSYRVVPKTAEGAGHLTPRDRSRSTRPGGGVYGDGRAVEPRAVQRGSHGRPRLLSHWSVA